MVVLAAQGDRCDYLRSLIAEYGRAHVIAQAKQRGYTDAMIERIKKQCRL